MVVTDGSAPGPLVTIGLVRTDHTEPEATPIQSGLNRDETGRVEVFDEYSDGLDGLDGFDHAWLVTWLHRAEVGRTGPAVLRPVPFLLRGEARPVGLFAMRGPRRVNPIGLSLVRLVSVAGSTVHFRGVDLLDGTPVLDIKPYVTRFDRPVGEPRCGWFDSVPLPERATPSDLG